MKKNKCILFVIVLAVGLFSFTAITEIKECYHTYKGSNILTAAKPEKIGKEAGKLTKLKTDKGEKEVSEIEGYRIIYLNGKNAPFVNLRVVLSNLALYKNDSTVVLNNLMYLNAQSKDMETKELIKLKFNGYTIYGISSNSIDKEGTLGNFVLFTGNNTIVYVDFNALKPDVRMFENLTEYKTMRNGFLANYTYYLKNCLK